MGSNHFTPPTPFDGLIGHRGIAKHAPENTLSSFLLCKQHGINWVEFDVRLTKDNELIIFHDDTLDRTTNGQGWVHEHTLAELKELDAGSWFSPRFAHERVLSLIEALPALLDMALFLNIELKIPPNASMEHEDILVIKLLQILDEIWPQERSLPLISSFHWNLLKKIRRVNAKLPLGFLHEDCNQSLLRTIRDIPNAAFHCHYQSLHPSLFALIRELKVPVLAYTVNEPTEAARLLKAGIFGVFSDDPKHIRDFQKASQKAL